jgi:hypothetical protein
MILHAHRPVTSDVSLEQVRRAADDLAAELRKHVDALAAVPAGTVRAVRLADLDEPVRRAFARWDEAVFAHTGTSPVALDSGFAEDLSD